MEGDVSKIRIPERHLQGVITLASLECGIADGVVKVLQDGPTLDRAQLTLKLSGAGIVADKAGSAAEALISLYFSRYQKDLDLETWTKQILDALKEQALSDYLSADTEVLKRLLSIQAMSIAAKVIALASSNERTYCRSRVVSDLRPVFGDDPSFGALGFSIIHLLEIDTHIDRSDHDVVHIALSTGDLEDLERVIQRAKMKAQVLREHLTGLNMRHYEFPEE